MIFGRVFSQQRRDVRDGHSANHRDHGNVAWAGGAYLPVMCDHILMTEGSGLFFGGFPALVQAAIGQKTSAEDFGRREKCIRRSAARWIFREPDDGRLHRADSRSGRLKLVHQTLSPFSPCEISRPALLRRRRLRNFFQAIPASNTTCAKSSARYRRCQRIRRVPRGVW